MGKFGKVAVALSMVLSVGVAFAADLDEYVQSDLVAMWDGYRNMGADKPHDSTSTVWYDTTGQYGFVLNNASFGDICCKFSNGYTISPSGVLSEEDTAETFDLARNGTVEIVFSQIFDGDAVLLQSSTQSGVSFGRTAAGTVLAGNGNGSYKFTYSTLNKFSSISVNFENGKSVSASANGAALETAGNDYYGSSNAKTYIGNRANLTKGFTGYIFAIRVYSRQLTPAEVAQNAVADRERYFNRKLKPSADYPAVDTMADVTVDKIFAVDDATTPNAAHEAAVAWLGENAGLTAAVVVPAGTWTLTAPIQLVAGEKLIGAGRDKTFFDCVAQEVSDAECAVKVASDDNLVRGITLFNVVETTKNAGNQPHAFFVEKGVVDNCRSAFHRSMYGSYGVSLYQRGGMVTNCLFDHVSISDMNANGLIARVNGGTLTDSEICYTDTGIGRGDCGGGLYVDGANAVVRNCVVHDCGKFAQYGAEDAAGVYVNNGTFENSVVYGCIANNQGQNATTAAGVHVKGGKMRYCTIVGNTTKNDQVGNSGLFQNGGDVRNCIIVDNWSPTLGANVTGGTFDYNLLNATVAGHDNNFTTTDAKFVDEGANDYHIAAKASVAVGKAMPVEGVTTDFDGVARDAEKPTIGAFEYVAQASEFLAEIQIATGEWREGSAPTVELIYDGVTDLSKLSVTWYVDGEEWSDAKDAVVPAFAGLGLGTHDLKAVATYEGQTKEPEAPGALTVLPVKVYVDLNGSNTYPYATPATAAHVLSDAYGALWKNVSETTTVEIAAGEYALGDTLNVKTPVVIAGAGREATKVVGFDTVTRLVTLDHADAVLRDLTVVDAQVGGAIDVVDGLVENCTVTNCQATLAGLSGVGVRVMKGTVRGCEIVDCHGLMSGGGSLGYGGGVAVVGKGVVRDCQIRRCWISGWGGGNAIAGGNGSGLYASAGLIENCVISDCGDHLRPHQSSDFPANGAVCLGNGDGATLRNVLVAGNVSEKLPVFSVAAGKAENVTVTGNETPEGVAAGLCQPGNLNQTFYDAMMTNCIVWGNSGVDFEAKQGVYSNATVVTTHDPKIGFCCYPTAEEGVDGNTAKDPKFRGGANRGLGVISSKGSCFRTGIVLDWMEGATDLKGNPRLTGGLVDRGCRQVGWDPGFRLLVR